MQIDAHGDVFRLTAYFQTKEAAEEAMAKLTKKARTSKKFVEMEA